MIAHLDVQEVVLRVSLDDGGYIVVFGDMVEHLRPNGARIDIGYDAGDIQFARAQAAEPVELGWRLTDTPRSRVK